MGGRKRQSAVEACVVQELGAPASALLERALGLAGFWEDIERVRRAVGVTRDRLRVIVKPDLDFYDPAVPDGTTPALVEHLVGLLHDRGFEDVVVGEGRNEPDAWLRNRDPLVVPELAGYAFATRKGRPYDIMDLHSEVRLACAEGARVPMSRHWLDAHYRIDFAKNRTHERHSYALCVHNLAGVAAPVDPEGRPRMRAAADDCLEVLRLAPPHFSVIDAWASCHGRAGHRAPRALATHAVIASPSAILADWVGAAKMGLDPYASEVNAAALRHVGLPAEHVIHGDLAPWPLWRNVHPLLAHSARQRDSSEAIGELAPAWFQSLDRERFPIAEFYNDRVNAVVAPIVARVDESTRSFLTVALLNYALSWIGLMVDAQHAMFAKGKVRRRILPPRVDPASFSAADYRRVPGCLAPYERLLRDFPATRNGLRWRHVDGSVVFSGAHVFPVAFEEFVSRVDIACAIQYMNDYVGGSSMAAARDRQGRVVHQLERNLYLPQPNWLILFGGECIDVEKIERIERRAGEHCITWRTVGSANGSASVDDGRVTFSRKGRAQTEVRIVARQKFAVPILFRLLDIDLAPDLRDSIIESAYATFLAGTMTNLQAACEGREFRIGREAGAREALRATPTGAITHHVATAAAAIAEGFQDRGVAGGIASWLFQPASVPASADAAELDANGFRHFRPPPPAAEGDKDSALVAGLAALARDAPSYVAGFAEALHKDLDRASRGGGDP